MGQLLGGRNRWDFWVPAGNLAVERRGKRVFTVLQREKSRDCWVPTGKGQMQEKEEVVCHA